MTEPTDVPPPAPAETTPPAPRTAEQIAKAERTVRLARALRDNLRRRKAVEPKRDRPDN